MLPLNKTLFLKMTLDKINPTKTKSWKKLKSLKSTVDLKTLFKNDNDRLKKYSISIDELYVDYSKNLIDDEKWYDLLNPEVCFKDEQNIKLNPYQTIWITNFKEE